MVTYKPGKKLERVINKGWSINIVDDELNTYVSCNKQSDWCTNFVVAKSSFK